MILSGKKDTTRRINDDKDIRVWDILSLCYKTWEEFARANVIRVKHTHFWSLTQEDTQGHESFSSEEEMLETYSRYYKQSVTPETDLKEYFWKQDLLQETLMPYGLIRVRGGNTFVLRQAMRYSGLDTVLHTFQETNHDIVYGWYSAGICVLSPTLRGLDLMDNPGAQPYSTPDQVTETIREGLGILDYCVVPHYQSDHPEAADAAKTYERYLLQGIPCTPLRDGEVIITSA